MLYEVLKVAEGAYPKLGEFVDSKKKEIKTGPNTDLVSSAIIAAARAVDYTGKTSSEAMLAAHEAIEAHITTLIDISDQISLQAQRERAEDGTSASSPE